MSSFKFLFFGWLFASQKTGFSGFRYRFIPSLRFGTGYASPYNPCHCLKLKNSKLNLKNQSFRHGIENEIEVPSPLFETISMPCVFSP